MHPMVSDGDGDGGGAAAADIFDCIQRGNTEQCVDLIHDDRSILKHKGWGGFTPLHYAALHGNRVLVDLFLSNGADPNLTCDAGQTAFHFACRHGNIYVMHQMMQHGADLRIIDLQGKTSLHHAVTGGNIVAMHYLWETGMFRFSDTDLYRVTPLHLAASTGNTEVVRYLLRVQRCAVDAVDQQGATALHVAAERGCVEVCWTLLQKAGYRLLHERNHSGLTPLDLSRQGKTFRHQQLTKLLSRSINEPIHHRPKEDHALYYWTLLFPSVGGAAILLIACLMGGYGGLTCSLLFPWLARSIFTQYHRMTTYQRLPNPIYLGTLIAGLFHSLLCFYAKIMPSVWPTGTLVQVSMVHFSLVMGLFCKILTQDPGTLGRQDADPRFSCVADLVENNQSPHRFCPYCELFLPDHAKHCKLCDACVRDYDHHCLFLNLCVGRGNHRLFLVFVLAMAAAHLLFIGTAIDYLLYVVTELGGRGATGWLSLLGAESWVVALAVMNGLTLVWEAWLLSEQFDGISQGTTTYFRQFDRDKAAPGGRQKPLRQRCATVLSFLLEGRRQIRQPDVTTIDI